MEEREGCLFEVSRTRSRAEADEEEEEVEEDDEALPTMEEVVLAAVAAAVVGSAEAAAVGVTVDINAGDVIGKESSSIANAFGVKITLSPPFPSPPPRRSPRSSSSSIRARSRRPSPLMGLRIVRGFQHKAPSRATGTDVGRGGTRFMARTSAASSADR